MDTCRLSDIIAVLDSLDAQQSIPKPKTALPLPKPAVVTRLTDNDYAERKARADLYVAKVLGAAEGKRNAAAFKLAARLRELFNLTDDDLLEVLSGWNSKNTPPLEMGELASIISHVVSYAKQPAGSGYEPLKRKTSKKRSNTAPGRKIKRRCFANISPRPIIFLISDFLPSGVIVSVISQEGYGKSTLAGSLAAAVSQGGNWPTGGHVQQGDVVIFSHEESPECSISPRLLANGADMGRVHFAESVIEIDGTENELDIERDIQVLDDWADELPGLRLVIFDPITSYVSASENSNSEVRRALKPLVDFAERRGVTVLALSHLSKKVDLGMINRTLGSRAWSSVPRMIWALQVEQVENEDGNKSETGSRFLLCVKCNLGKKPKGLKFSIGDGGKVVFDTMRIDRDIDDSGGIKPSRGSEIREWLIERIGADAVPAAEITKEGCQRWGISKQRLGKISTEAGINKRFFDTEKCWVWSVK